MQKLPLAANAAISRASVTALCSYVQLWYHALLIVVKHYILRRLDKHRSCRGARGRAEPPSGAGRPAQPGRGSGRARRAEGRGRRATDAQPGARRRRGSRSRNQRSTKRRAGTAFYFPSTVFVAVPLITLREDLWLL